MEKTVNKTILRLVKGDITTLAVDAVVNAANSSLLGGGGVDGAIHAAGGPAIFEECRKLNGCATGEAKITTGGNLPAKYVIHTVGPVWHGGSRGEADLLASAYRRSLEVADENGVTSVAFPSISTGVYRFPKERACAIALETVKNHTAGKTGIKEIVFCVFSDADLSIYQKGFTNV